MILTYSLKPTFSQKKYYQSIWHDDSLQIQLNTNNIEHYKFNAKNNIFYLLSNDNKKLYINMVVPNLAEQQKILRFGLTVWVDPKGKTNQKFGIKFPLGNASQQRTNTPHENNARGQRSRMNMKRDMEIKKIQLLQQNQAMELIGFNGYGESQLVPATDTNNIHGILSYDDKEYLNYKLVIPIKEIKTISSSKNNLLLISLGIESGFLDITNIPDRGEMRTPGGRSGMQSEGRPGGIPGGRTGARPGGFDPTRIQQMRETRQAMTSPINFWIKKIKLAE